MVPTMRTRTESKIDLRSLPFVHGWQRFALPHYGAVYFVLEKSKIVYIGETGNLRRRFVAHKAHSTTCTIRWIQVTNPYQRRELEAQYVQQYQPTKQSAFDSAWRIG